MDTAAWFVVLVHVEGQAPTAHVIWANARIDEAMRVRLTRDGRTVFQIPREYLLEAAPCASQREADDRAKAFRERMRDTGRWRIEEGSVARRTRVRRAGEGPASPEAAGGILEGVSVRLKE